MQSISSDFSLISYLCVWNLKHCHCYLIKISQLYDFIVKLNIPVRAEITQPLLLDKITYIKLSRKKMIDKQKKPRSFLGHACMQTAAGATAGKVLHKENNIQFKPIIYFYDQGFVKVCVMHPLDLIKTRLQLQIKTSQISSQHKVSFSNR